MIYQDTDRRLMDAASDFAKKKESIILEQLGDLIKQGLLVIVETQPVITFDYVTGSLKMDGAIKLHLRDKERMEEMRLEIESLKADKANMCRDIVDLCKKQGLL